MNAISEQVIDGVVNRIDDMPEANYEKWAAAFARNQPVLISWLFGETFDSLTDEEQGYLEYLALIIWLSIREENEQIEKAQENFIGEWEERNCEIMESTKGAFADKLDDFFDGYAQEDLLAFVEDALLDEEGEAEAVVTKEGRELMFIALKTVIDVLTIE